MRYEAMLALTGQHSVRMMARVLGVKEAAYYQWKRRRKVANLRQQREQSLIKAIRTVFDESDQTYGYRKMMRALAEYGIYLSEYRVRSIMRAGGMYPVACFKYKPTSKGKATGRYLDNLFNQDFSTTRLNQKWAGDITYIKTRLGWVYLACVIDLHNKEVVGYSIAKKADAELVCRALSYALSRRDIMPDTDLVFHCDRGVQYASKRFQTMLATNGITGSMSRAGCPFDNAPAESFFSAAKKERIYRRDYQDISEVKADLFDYIEIFYNGKRIQAGLGYKSPVTYRGIIESRKAA